MRRVWITVCAGLTIAALVGSPLIIPTDTDRDRALNSSQWSAGGASVSDSPEGVEIDMPSSLDAAALPVDSGARAVTVAYDVVNVSSTTTEVNLEIHDATDSDVTTLKLYDGDADTSTDAVGANTTGGDKLVQTRIGLEEISQILVTADGGATVEIRSIEWRDS